VTPSTCKRRRMTSGAKVLHTAHLSHGPDFSVSVYHWHYLRHGNNNY
jgi:hypothetical protein